MKMRILVCVAIYALLMCHPMISGQRPKRTIGKMLENFMDTMRQTFGAEQAPPLPPDVIARVTKLPYGMHYSYYPTVRMHIRPVNNVDKHIIYVKTVPPSVVRHSMPSDVDIIRFVQPIVRMPKSKTTTTIHYEIIPVPVPIHASALQAALPASNDHSSLVNEKEQLSQIPWSMEVLPPPVSTSKPSEPTDEEPAIPWNLHALPPPVATKRPQWHSNAEWAQMKPMTQADKHGFMIPLVQKKLVIPADFGQLQQNVFFENHGKQFVPSQLQSEVSVEPSLEIAAFSQTDPVTHQLQPRSKFAQRTFAKVDWHPPRLRRDTTSSFLPYAQPQKFQMGENTDSLSILPSIEHILRGNHSTPVISKTSAVEPLTLNAQFHKKLSPLEDSVFHDKGTSNVLHDYLKFGMKNIKLNQTKDQSTTGPKESSATSSNLHSVSAPELPLMYDFGEYSDNEDADKEDAHRTQTENHELHSNFNNSLVTVVKVPDWLSESAPEKYVSITPKPNYSRKMSDSNRVSRAQHANEGIGKTRFDYTKDQPSFRYFNANTSPTFEYRDERQADSQGYSDSSRHSESPKNGFRLPEISLLSRFPVDDAYRDLFPDKPLFDKFLSGKSNKFDLPFGNEKRDKLPHFDYDNIEYFEPIVIDIDKERSKSDFSSKLRYKYKNIDKLKGSNEPLKLPDSLHETIDFLKKPRMHPPIFDLDGEASEYKIIAILNGNEIT